MLRYEKKGDNSIVVLGLLAIICQIYVLVSVGGFVSAGCEVLDGLNAKVISCGHGISHYLGFIKLLLNALAKTLFVKSCV